MIQRGILRIENTAGAKEDVARDIIDSLGIDLDKDPNFAADEDIKKHLSGSAKKIGEWMDTIVEPSVRDRIFDIAMEMNLPMNKIQVLQEKMPDHTFIGD